MRDLSNFVVCFVRLVTGKDRDKDRDNFAATDEGQSKWRPDPDANEPDFYEV